MTTSNQNQLEGYIRNVLVSCKGESWEAKTIQNLRKELKARLGIRDLLIDKLIKAAI